MAKKPTAAEAAETQTAAGPADGATPASAAPEAVAALREMMGSVAADAGNPPIIPAPMELELIVRAHVLGPLIHDGVTYAEGSVVSLTPDQHRDLVRAGVVSDQPVEALPY